MLDILRSGGEERFQTEPKQEEALEKIILDGQDCLIVLPTGYGKSLIQFFSFFLYYLHDRVDKDSSRDKSVVNVASPLNILIDDQINKLNALGVCCASLCLCGDDADGRFEASFQENLQRETFS